MPVETSIHNIMSVPSLSLLTSGSVHADRSIEAYQIMLMAQRCQLKTVPALIGKICMYRNGMRSNSGDLRPVMTVSVSESKTLGPLVVVRIKIETAAKKFNTEVAALHATSPTESWRCGLKRIEAEVAN